MAGVHSWSGSTRPRAGAGLRLTRRRSTRNFGVRREDERMQAVEQRALLRDDAVDVPLHGIVHRSSRQRGAAESSPDMLGNRLREVRLLAELAMFCGSPGRGGHREALPSPCGCVAATAAEASQQFAQRRVLVGTSGGSARGTAARGSGARSRGWDGRADRPRARRPGAPRSTLPPTPLGRGPGGLVTAHGAQHQASRDDCAPVMWTGARNLVRRRSTPLAGAGSAEARMGCAQADEPHSVSAAKLRGASVVVSGFAPAQAE